MSQEITNRPVPNCYSKRCKKLSFWWHAMKISFVLLGGLSVTFATLAVITDDTPAKICAGLSAVLTSLMGFLKPNTHFIELKKAWSKLDLAIMQYQNGSIELDELHQALADGEHQLIEFEEKS